MAHIQPQSLKRWSCKRHSINRFFWRRSKFLVLRPLTATSFSSGSLVSFTAMGVSPSSWFMVRVRVTAASMPVVRWPSASTRSSAWTRTWVRPASWAGPACWAKPAPPEPKAEVTWRGEPWAVGNHGQQASQLECGAMLLQVLRRKWLWLLCGV